MNGGLDGQVLLNLSEVREQATSEVLYLYKSKLLVIIMLTLWIIN
ncbi:MAG: hypothetical protein ACTS6P_00420 [Candidatus Hodgkinia cicadicola]